MTNWKFKTIKQFIEQNYWENPEDAIDEIRIFLNCQQVKTEIIPLEPLQSVLDILFSPYLEDSEKVERAISKTKEISIKIKQNLGRFLRKAHINCSHDMETAKGFVSLLKVFNMYSAEIQRSA